jgi:DNA-binding transcriptional ArsR family regulator
MFVFAGETHMDFVFKLKADFFKALGHPTRLRILEYLKGHEASVGAMVAKLGVEQSMLSKHLLLLKQAGVLASRQEGTTVFYRIEDKHAYAILGLASKILRSRLVKGRVLLLKLEKSSVTRVTSRRG